MFNNKSFFIIILVNFSVYHIGEKFRLPSVLFCNCFQLNAFEKNSPNCFF